MKKEERIKCFEVVEWKGKKSESEGSWHDMEDLGGWEKGWKNLGNLKREEVEVLKRRKEREMGLEVDF